MQKILFHFTCLVLLFVFLTGCGKREILSTVSGSVTCNGKPYGGGSVVFFNLETRQSATGYLDSEGKYKFAVYVPIGEYCVFIGGNPPLDPGVEDKRELPKCPERYKNYKTSGWVYEIKKGENIKDFEMTSN